MTDFKSGGIPNPDYDSEDINFVNQKTEFTEDVFVYGKLYADLGGDVQTFSTAGRERIRITKDGFVGIDATDPQVRLDVGGVSSQGLDGLSNSVLYAGYLNTTDFGGVVLGAGLNGNTPFVAASKLSNGSPLALELITNGSTRVRIDTGGQVVFKPMTQTARDALNPAKGGVIFNQTTNKLQCWDGSSWNNLF